VRQRRAARIEGVDLDLIAQDPNSRMACETLSPPEWWSSRNGRAADWDSTSPKSMDEVGRCRSRLSCRFTHGKKIRNVSRRYGKPVRLYLMTRRRGANCKR
jgi:hypothetical protein